MPRATTAKPTTPPRKKTVKAPAVAPQENITPDAITAKTATASRKKTVKAPVAAVSAATICPENRQHHIQEAAYYLAERGGFSGNPEDYWLQAEAQIDLSKA
ncbi:DUF2934 domain-containing protein [Propionivibrio dicarboxylicus]|uniref:DUF2934 domain-containing protein n=1 Tax=Propionivibrio dicarboxylicus TaxID=83767 RepID=A0A1G8AB11_9RHOO|nr:DUF2934 domain-containing protein [Propionivibrio dicarboxylicus]SDH18122.1 Protein of unknown function [Propionivibrio dicarboxylicus]